jgi:hypothetical protein
MRVCNTLGLASGTGGVGHESQAVEVGLGRWRRQAIGFRSRALFLLVDNDQWCTFFELANFGTVCYHHGRSSVLQDICEKLGRICQLENQESTSSA